ncbi:GUN4 N-terminal ARM-like repeat domain-containing protein [Leptolyngbya sp. AN02str]|uniref:GUN4 N-terminal ARM-like repeat domain-containing protein n=1 Tax=Leptolyngbya sp. AN02str TaxID=3423363 RepID=UPI003D31955C
MDDVQTNLNQSPASSNAASVSSPAEFMADFFARLQSESEKNQLQLVQELANKGDSGLEVLMTWLQERRHSAAGFSPSMVDGKVHQLLMAANSPATQSFLETQLADGLAPWRSQSGVDFALLAQLLAKQEYQAADKLTLELMCQLVGDTALQRRWIYFTEVDKLSVADLRTINTLWLIYSEGRFGFSVQRDLWLSTGRNWERLWEMIGWKQGINWTRYPGGFTWSLNAPRGHLPLSNQLRGVRFIAALFSHPAWLKDTPSE